MTEDSGSFWPAHEPFASFRGMPGWRFAATICRRGHVVEHKIDEKPSHVGHCSRCGADVLSACPDCRTRLKGSPYHSGRTGVTMPFKPRPFCDGCGSAMPWASRQQRIWELQNILDQHDIDEADRLWIGEQLQRLQTEGASMTEKQERDIWSGVKKRAPELFTGAGGALIGGLATAAIEPLLGLQ